MTESSPQSQALIAALRESIAAAEAQRAVPLPYLSESGRACLRKAQALLARRERSCRELEQRLEAAEFDPGDIGVVVGYLRDTGVLDDARFATEWVRQRHTYHGKARRVLRQELAEKGITGALAEAALGTISDRDEWELGRELARKKAASLPHPPQDRAERDKYLRRICGVLARRGISEGQALSLAREALVERFAD